MENYKQEIEDTRVGCLGGSDAKELFKTAVWGYVKDSFKHRLAVCKGLVKNKNVTTRAMLFGDFVEQNVYEHLKATDSRWQSNPCLVSEKYSRKNVKCIDHVDLLLRDDDSKTITIGEVKASMHTFEQVRHEYDEQLQHHALLGAEYAKKCGDYKLRILLCHYKVDVNLNEEFVFDHSKLRVKQVKLAKGAYRLDKAMDIVDRYLEHLDYYTEEDSIDFELLPANVKSEFNMIEAALIEIKEREDRVADFKKRLYAFLQEHGIKSIKNDSWSITRVDDTVTKTFDYIRYIGDLSEKHPRLARKIREEYTKTIKRSGFVSIKLNNKTT